MTFTEEPQHCAASVGDLLRDGRFDWLGDFHFLGS